jgi:hypothetical protein
MTAGGGNQSSTALVLYVWFPQGAEIQSETLPKADTGPSVSLTLLAFGFPLNVMAP